jgi:hypothetical protein
MNTQQRWRLRLAFQKPTYLPLKITPEGFEIDGNTFSELQGRVIKMTLIRKLFEDGIPTCSSPDGIRSDDGTACDDCQHPRCQPRLRLQLRAGSQVYLLDLATTSAKNLFALEDEAEAQGHELLDSTLKLTVVGHDHWGEVRFELLDQLPTKN